MNVCDLSVSANIGIGCALLYILFAMHRRASSGKWPVPSAGVVFVAVCACFALWCGSNFIADITASDLKSAAFEGIGVVLFTVLGLDRVRAALGKRSLFQHQTALSR